MLTAPKFASIVLPVTSALKVQSSQLSVQLGPFVQLSRLQGMKTLVQQERIRDLFLLKISKSARHALLVTTALKALYFPSNVPLVAITRIHHKPLLIIAKNVTAKDLVLLMQTKKAKWDYTAHMVTSVLREQAFLRNTPALLGHSQMILALQTFRVASNVLINSLASRDLIH